MIVNGKERSNSKRRRNAKASRRNAEVRHVIEQGASFFDSRGVQYASMDCSTPVYGKAVDSEGNKIVQYFIKKCRIVKL